MKLNRLVFLLLCAALGVVRGQSMEEDLAWFATLGLPQPTTAPFVQIDLGWSREVDGKDQIQFGYGYLVKEDKNQITILDPAMRESTLSLEPNPYLPDLSKPVTFQPTNFVEFATRRLNEEDVYDLETFCLTAQLWRLGQRQIAEAHYQKAKATWNPDPMFARAKTWSEWIREALGKQFLSTAQGTFRLPNEQWSESLERFQFVSRHFPNSQEATQAEYCIQMIQRMAEEDRAHPVPKDLAALPLEDRILELIHQLRGQPSFQFILPGAPTIFEFQGGDTPADRLARIGPPTYPHLMKALEDERFTRGYPIRVGDCARMIIEKISGESMSDCPYLFGPAGDKTQLEPILERLEAWWKDYQETGELGVLAKGVRRADEQSRQKASLLIEKYPKDALAPILDAIGNPAGSASTRASLISLVPQVDGGGRVEFLRTWLNRDPTLHGRVMAANALRELADADSANMAMLREWHNRQHWLAQKVEFGERQGMDELIKFLVEANSPEILDRMGKDYPELSVRLRWDILNELESLAGIWDREDEFSKEPTAAVERFLTAALRDEWAVAGTSISNGTGRVSSPRLCDWAVHGLASWFPTKYQPENYGSFWKREARRLAAINAWNQSQGKPSPPSPALDLAAVRPAGLDTLIRFHPEPPAAEILGAIQMRGLQGLPAALKAERAVPDEHPAKEDCRKLITELGNTIVEARVLHDFETAPDWVKELNALSSTYLNAEGFTRLMQSLMERRTECQKGAVSVLRAADLTGIVITIQLNRNPSGDDLQSGGFSDSVFRDGKMVRSGGGGLYLPSRLEEIRGSTEIAIAYPPDAEVTIHHSWGWSRD